MTREQPQTASEAYMRAVYAYHPDLDGGDGEPVSWRDHSDEGWDSAGRELERADHLQARVRELEDGIRGLDCRGVVCGTEGGGRCQPCALRDRLLDGEGGER